jgi:hypothetical protein
MTRSRLGSMKYGFGLWRQHMLIEMQDDFNRSIEHTSCLWNGRTLYDALAVLISKHSTSMFDAFKRWQLFVVEAKEEVTI